MTSSNGSFFRVTGHMCAGNSPVTLIFFLILRLKKRLCDGAGDLKHHRAHYEATIMRYCPFICIRHLPKSWHGARPIKGISIEFEIGSKFLVLWFKMCSTDHNEIFHTSRQWRSDRLNMWWTRASQSFNEFRIWSKYRFVLLALCESNSPVTDALPSTSNAQLYRWSEHAAEQTVKLPMLWDTMWLAWRHSPTEYSGDDGQWNVTISASYVIGRTSISYHLLKLRCRHHQSRISCRCLKINYVNCMFARHHKNVAK